MATQNACTGCGELGHNLRTCPRPDAIEHSRERERARSRAKSKKQFATRLDVRKKSYAYKAKRNRRGLISLTELREEGVREIVRAPGTSVIFVWTTVSLRIFHAKQLPDRDLDAYAIGLAVRWLETGVPACEVASRLDVAEEHLAKSLEREGYERQSLNDRGPRQGSAQRRRDNATGGRGGEWSARYKGNRKVNTHVRRRRRCQNAACSKRLTTAELVIATDEARKGRVLSDVILVPKAEVEQMLIMMVEALATRLGGKDVVALVSSVLQEKTTTEGQDNDDHGTGQPGQ